MDWFNRAYQSLRNRAYRASLKISVGYEKAFSASYDFFTQPAISGPLQYSSSQLLEGVKTITTLPFTVLQMPFHSASRKLGWHITKYNVAYYLLPILAYYSQFRAPLETVIGEGVVAADLAVNLLFMRSCVNAYLLNTFNSINASSIKMNEINEVLPECNCRESLHVKATLMSPAYYLSKIHSLSLFSYLPGIGPLFSALKPLAYGESLAESKLGGLCHDHRNEYLAQHTIYSLGLGLGAMACTKLTAYSLSAYTGVTSFWLEDAVFNFLFPLMVFHMSNQAYSPHISSGPNLDVFYYARDFVKRLSEKSAQEIVPRLMQANEDGPILDYLKSVWDSNPLHAMRTLLLYPKFQKDLKTFVEMDPVRLLIDENGPLLAEKIALIHQLLDNAPYVRTGIDLYEWLPFVPAMEHKKFIIRLLTQEPEKTRRVIQTVSDLLVHAQDYTLGYEIRAHFLDEAQRPVKSIPDINSLINHDYDPAQRLAGPPLTPQLELLKVTEQPSDDVNNFGKQESVQARPMSCINLEASYLPGYVTEPDKPSRDRSPTLRRRTPK